MMFVETIAALTSRASIENPNTPLTSANLAARLGGTETSSGVKVNRDTLLGHPAIWSGLQLITSDVSKLPIFVYRKQGDQRAADLGHPASLLLRKRVNAAVKSKTFLQTIVGHALTHRGGYARIFRTEGGRPTMLDLLDPEQTFPAVINGELRYQTRIDGTERNLAGQDVFHVRGLGWSGIDGWSLIDKLRDAVGLGLAAQQFGGRYFMNSAQPRVVIKMPGYLSGTEAIERLRASWGDVHGGLKNAHKPAILEGGADIEPFQITNEDSQFLQLREFDVKMVAAILRIPSHMLGDDTRTSLASLEQESQRYLDNAIDPWLREIETEANDKLLTVRQNETESHCVEFVRSAFVRANLKERAAAYSEGITGGWMSPLQAMLKENLPVDEGQREELAKHWRPLNMGLVGEPMPEEEEPTAPPVRAVEHDDSAIRELLHDRTQQASTRLVKRVAKAVERAANDPKTFVTWIDTSLAAKNAGVFVEEFESLCGDDAERIVHDFFVRLSDDLLDMSGKVQPAQLADTVSQVVSGYVQEIPQQLTQQLLSHTKAGDLS